MTSLPVEPWPLDHEIIKQENLARDWLPSEWIAFSAMVEKFLTYGSAGGVEQRVLDLVSEIKVYPIPWGTVLDVSDFFDCPMYVTIGAAADYQNIALQLSDQYKVRQEVVPRTWAGLYKVNADHTVAQSFAAYGEWKPNAEKIVLMDPFCLYYPYLGPSNYGHEIAHAFSIEEELPRSVEEAVLRGALKTEPESEHPLINVMIEYLELRRSRD